MLGLAGPASGVVRQVARPHGFARSPGDGGAVWFALPRGGFQEGGAMSLINRRLVFHIGGLKTGSTALQHSLLLNVEALKRLSFDYKNAVAPSTPVSGHSGNGPRLLRLITSDDWSESALDEVIESYVGEGHTAVCSSELLVQLDESAWAKLGESCQAKDRKSTSL